jgi:hypothetical protein
MPTVCADGKPDIGGIYLHPPGASDCGEEYTYTLYERDGRVFVTALGVYPDRVIFEGPLADFPCEDNG